MQGNSYSYESLSAVRPSVIDIDLDAVVNNFLLIKEKVGKSAVMPILKANAYGHGLLQVAQVLEEAGAERYCLAYLEEAVALRRAGIDIPLLVLGPAAKEQIPDFIKYDIELTIPSIYKLHEVEEVAKAVGKKAKLHLKIDTGMERIGTHYYSANTFLEETIKCPNCDIVGIFSHFATDEEEDLSFAHLQLERFLEIASFFEKHSLPTPLRHIANSAAICRMPESYLDGVRPGLTLYGIQIAPHIKILEGTKRTFKLSSKVSYFKVVKPNVGIGYDLTYTTQNQTRVVTIPIGYGDGFPRRLSNKGSVIIRGHKYPIVGKVCMDQLMVDVGPEGEAYNGDEVILIGEQGNEIITVEEIADMVGTDVRDVLCSTNLRIPRRYHYKNKTFVD